MGRKSVLSNKTNTWLIHNDHLKNAQTQIAKEISTEEMASFMSEQKTVELNINIQDGIAVIEVSGVIYGKKDMWTEWFGLTTQEGIIEQIEEAITKEVDSILLVFDTPGGVASGVNELAKWIKDIDSKIPVNGFINGMACSAGYWLAASCRKLYANEDAFVGSIGVVQTHVKQVEADMFGDKFIEITSTNAPNKRLDPTVDADVTKIRSTLDSIEELFINAVAEGRGVSTEFVKQNFGQGGVLIASKAESAGMVDTVSDYEASLEDIPMVTSTKKEGTMSDKTKTFSQVEVDQIKADAIQEGKDSVSTETIKSESFKDGVKAESDRLTSLEAVAIPGAEALLATAKADTSYTAEKLAMAIVAKTKEMGADWMGNVKAQETDTKDIDPKAEDQAPEAGDVTAENVGDKVDAAAEALMAKDSTLTYDQAVTEAVESNPKLSAYYK